MFKNRHIIYIVIFVFFISLAGCAGLQRKFTRKKKEEEKSPPIITMYDYSKELRVDELYKKHFLFWKSWHQELIDKMNLSYKKRSECFEYTVASLIEMRKYLTGSKLEELEPFIVKIKSIDADVKKKRLSRSEEFRMKQLLEKTRRQIDKKFSYSNVKDYLELRNQ